MPVGRPHSPDEWNVLRHLYTRWRKAHVTNVLQKILKHLASSKIPFSTGQNFHQSSDAGDYIFWMNIECQPSLEENGKVQMLRHQSAVKEMFCIDLGKYSFLMLFLKILHFQMWDVEFWRILIQAQHFVLLNIWITWYERLRYISQNEFQAIWNYLFSFKCVFTRKIQLASLWRRSTPKLEIVLKFINFVSLFKMVLNQSACPREYFSTWWCYFGLNHIILKDALKMEMQIFAWRTQTNNFSHFFCF